MRASNLCSHWLLNKTELTFAKTSGTVTADSTSPTTFEFDKEEEGSGGGRLLTFSAFRMGAISRLGAFSNKYGSPFVSFQFHDCCFPQLFLTLKKDHLMAVDHIETRTLSFQSRLVSIFSSSFFSPLTTECKDDNENCPAWAAQPNGCKKNSDYMRSSCKKSCNVCRKYSSSPSFPLRFALLLLLLLLLLLFFTFFLSVYLFFFMSAQVLKNTLN